MGLSKNAVLLGGFALFGASVLAEEVKMQTLNLMPVPEQIKLLDGFFRLDSAFTVSVEGAATPRLCRAASRMLRRLSNRTGLFFTQNLLSPGTNPDSPAMTVRVD